MPLTLTFAESPSPEILRLWDGDAPMAGGETQPDVPTLRLYRVESSEPTAAVVIIPGGGYGMLAMDHEGEQIATWLNKMGVTAAVCVYRHRGTPAQIVDDKPVAQPLGTGRGNAGKGYSHPVPMLDAQRAIRTMRANASQWNIDPAKIGVLGFSAGGHLASTVSTHHDSGNADSDDMIEQASCRPDFSILAYPVIVLGESFTHRGSELNLLGENPAPELIRDLSNHLAVDSRTPPTFIFHTVEDTAVPVEHSLEYFRALRAANVPAEMHLFETGRHGVGLATGMPGPSAWPSLCKSWMKLHGWTE